MKRKRGFFIVFEGGEGTGKSTQMALLVRWLKQQRVSVLVTLEPGGTKIGSQIRKILLNHHFDHLSSRAELFLYQADRAQHVDEVIVPALKAGKIVISDRFSDSSLVYQGMCRGLGVEWTGQLNQFATGGLLPDLVIILDVAEKIAFRRLQKRKTLDRLEREKKAFHRKVRRGFLELARKYPKRFAVVDTAFDRLAVFNEVKQIVSERVGL